MKAIRLALCSVISLFAIQVADAGSFERTPREIQILPDRVRIYLGTTYGTCGQFEGWWGWSTSDPRHKDWLELVYFAIDKGLTLVFYDAQDSCYGPGGDTLEIDGLFGKLNGNF